MEKHFLGYYAMGEQLYAVTMDAMGRTGFQSVLLWLKRRDGWECREDERR